MTRMRPSSGLRSIPAIVALVLLGAPAESSAQSFTTVHSFSAEAGAPQGPLVLASDGRLYGTTSKGCIYGLGSVYAMIPDGLGGFIHSDVGCFATADSGHAPLGGLVEGADGALYGTASRGGPSDAGAVFRMTKAGVLSFLHVFAGADGKEPHGSLVLASDGAFYGTTAFGGANDLGTVFRVDASGDFASLHSFDGTDGTQPMAGLLEGADDALYGTTYLSTQTGFGGTVFRITKAGALTTLHAFAYPYTYPKSPLIQLADGKLYGTTSWYPATAFRISPDGNDFQNLMNIPASNAGLEEGADGYLYGTGEGSVFRLTPVNFNLQTLHTFSAITGIPSALVETASGFIGTCPGIEGYGEGFVFRVTPSGAYQELHAFRAAPRGRRPTGGIVEGSDGGIYGTTEAGGGGFGTIFRVGRRGGHWTLRRLIGLDGQTPLTGLVTGADGAFYGTTRFGGAIGWGTAFRIDAGGTFSVFHDFDGTSGSPASALGRTSDGAFLGSTWQGSAAWGSLYRLDTAGAFDVLHDFNGYDAALVFGRPLEASDGAVLGTSMAGGTYNAGTVYRWDSLNGFLSLSSFTPTLTEGWRPQAGLIETSSGDFYGTTDSGGPSDLGTVFHMDFGGALTFLHHFAEDDGGRLSSELLDAADGKLYGVAPEYGADGQGTIFRVDPLGAFEKLHDFSGAGGGKPLGPLLRAGDGALYGSASEGGVYGGGIIFRLVVPELLSLTDVSPDSGPASGGTPLVVSGSNFQPGAALTLGGVGRPAAVDDPAHISTTSAPASAGTLGDLVVSNPGGESVRILEAFFTDFLDVPPSHPFQEFVESLVRAGITAGCGGGNYCAASPVTRAQMAVFLLKAEHGAAYAPPSCTGTFADVACPGGFAVDWIEQLAAESVTTGCGGGNYCPDSPVTRAQMAVFLLKTSLGPGYIPPPATGIFGDVPPGFFAADWIEDLYTRAVTGGCNASPLLYCPNNPNTRGQMAVFITKTIGL